MSSESFDMNALLQQAMSIQQRLADAQQHAAEQRVEGCSGGAVVRITMTGAGDVTEVKIDATAVEAGDVELLEDLVLAAFHDAQAKVASLQREAVGGSDGLGGLAGGLGGLLGSG